MRIRCQKAVLLKSKYTNTILKKRDFFNIVFDKMKLFVKFLLLIINIRIDKNLIYDNLIYDPNFNNFEIRKHYVSYFTDIKEFVFLNYRKTLYFKNFLSVVFFFKKVIFNLFKYKLIFRCSKISDSIIFEFIINKSYIETIIPKNIFLFNFLSPVSYLTAQYCGKNFGDKIKVYYIYTSGFIYETCRYDSFENVNIILGSKLQKNEIEYYKKANWMKIRNCKIEFWGVDNIKLVNSFLKEKKYDIAIYSSGEWARPQGFLRGEDIEKIKNYEYCDNIYYNFFEKIINILKQKQYQNKIIKVYFHPFEKELMKKYKIFPPFWDDLIKKENFILDISENISNFLEAKIGITVYSSIAYDRLNYNLPTLFFLPIEKSKQFIGLPPKKIFKSYDKYLYSSIDEFQKKLDDLLND